MSFHDVRFPARLSFGSSGGPERRTDIVALASGAEERNTPWAHSRRRYDAGIGLRSLDDLADLIAFFEARRGRLHAFRWKDWADFKSCAPSGSVTPYDQLIGTGDGTTATFRLIKDYRSGGHGYARPIEKPVPGSVAVAVDGAGLSDGAGFTCDASMGVVTFDTAPAPGAEIRAGFEFDVPVRFDSDRIEANMATFQAGEVPSVPVIEVRP